MNYGNNVPTLISRLFNRIKISELIKTPTYWNLSREISRETSMLRGGGCKWEGGHRQAKGDIYSSSLTREQGGKNRRRIED